MGIDPTVINVSPSLLRATKKPGETYVELRRNTLAQTPRQKLHELTIGMSKSPLVLTFIFSRLYWKNRSVFYEHCLHPVDLHTIWWLFAILQETIFIIPKGPYWLCFESYHKPVCLLWHSTSYLLKWVLHAWGYLVEYCVFPNNWINLTESYNA